MASGDIDVKAEGRKAIERQQDAMRQAAGKDYLNIGPRVFRPPMPKRYATRYADWVATSKAAQLKKPEEKYGRRLKRSGGKSLSHKAR
jgi:hypothetical protein